MCGRLYVRSATCVVSYMCGYDLLTTEVSFMRGYTGVEWMDTGTGHELPF